MAQRRKAAPTTPPRSRQAATTEGRGSRRRQELLEVAAEVIAQRGFRSATVRDIGDAAGILSGSLYHHFTSKEQILEELLSGYLDRLVVDYRSAALADAPPAEVFARMVEVGLTTVFKDRHLAQIVQNDYTYLSEEPQFAFVVEGYRAIQALWLEVFRAGQASGDFRDDHKPESVYRVVMGSLLSATRWHHLTSVQACREAAQEVSGVLLGGVAAP
jgi:TetR/AcrR family transcriptional regulator, cholesterol catabolism regulator